MIRLHGYTDTHSDPRFIQTWIVRPGKMPCLKHGNLMVPPACQVGQSASVQQSVFRHPNIVFSLIYARITESPKLFTIQLNPTINTVSPTPNPSALYDMTLFLLRSMMYTIIPCWTATASAVPVTADRSGARAAATITGMTWTTVWRRMGRGSFWAPCQRWNAGSCRALNGRSGTSIRDKTHIQDVVPRRPAFERHGSI